MNRERWWLLLPHPVRQLPADLAVVLAAVGLTLVFVFVPVINETPLRVIIGLVFVLFVPGYAFIAALFPEASSGPDKAKTTTGNDGEPTERSSARIGQRGIDGIERVALSFGLSIALVPLIGLVLNFTPFGIRLVPIVVSLSGFTVGMVWIAMRRRRALPPDDRFYVPYRRWIETGRAEFLETESRTDVALNVLLIASIVLAFGAVGYAIAVPPQGEQFSELYLLTEADDGKLVAEGYPEEIQLGGSESIVVGVGNHEHETIGYTVVVQLQQVEFEDNETHVLEYDELARFETTLGHNETWHHQHEITPTMAGDELRLQYLLYRGEPPDEPSPDSAYRDVHLWIDVSEGEAE